MERRPITEAKDGYKHFPLNPQHRDRAGMRAEL